MGAAVSITRLDSPASELRKAASGERYSAAARRILTLTRVLDGVDRKRRPKRAAWTVRPCGTGCIVTTARDLPGFAISNRRVPDENSRHSNRLNWPSLSRPVPTPRCTVSCVGGGRSARRIAAALRCRVTRAFGREGSGQARLPQLSVRPRHPKADEEAQETFRKTSPRQSRRESPTAPKASRSKSGYKMRPGSASRAR